MSQVPASGWNEIPPAVRRLSLAVALVALAAVLYLVVAGDGVGAPSAEAGAAAGRGGEPEVADLVDRLDAALGGRDAWERTRFLRFRFAESRTHHWDRYTGRHRVEWEDQEGHRIVVLHNITSRKGNAYVDGEPASGEQLQELLERAFRAWVNDTYWLLMPYKLRDPGVHLDYAGREEIDGVVYDKLRVSFDAGVGLTSGDVYWAFLHPETGLLDYWEFLLEGREPPPQRFAWLGWQPHGEILLAPLRRHTESGRELPLDRLAVLDELPDRLFDSPEPRLVDGIEELGRRFHHLE